MIIDTSGNSAADQGGSRMEAGIPRRRGKSNLVRQHEAQQQPGLSKAAIPLQTLSGQPATRRRTVDCGELFRSWAFPGD